MAIEGSDLRGKLLKLSKADPTPLLRDLYRHITPQYAADWKVIGTLLGLPSGELKAIEARYPIGVEQCCNQMLRKWLKTDTTASWEKLLTVIESPAVSGSAPDKATQLTSKLDQLTIIGKDHETPLLKDLYKHITPQYAAHWREMGTLLGLSSKTLDIIGYDNPYNAMECCNAMLKKWLEVDTTASWRKFFTAIESPAASGSAPDKATLMASKQRQLIIPVNGTRLAEYEVFIQYYNKLIISLKNCKTWLLFRDCLDSDDYYTIEDYIDMVYSKDDPELEARTSEDTFKPKTKDISTPVMMSSIKVSLSGTDFSKDAFEIGMWLAIIAIKLYYYNTELFYKILEFMQSCNRDPGVRQLATEILSKVKEFDPLNSSSSQLLEFDVFMKYCSWFTEIFLDIDMLFRAKVITEVDRDFIMCYGDRSSFNIIVIKLINQLLSGDASYFYKLLEAIQHHYMYKGVASIFYYTKVASRYRSIEVTSRIQTEIYLWNRMMSTGSNCPTLDDLHKLVTPRCAAHWKFIGKRLNFTPTSLKAIHDGNLGDDNKCCNTLWSKWLDTDPQATWEKLIFAIDTKSSEYEVFIQYYNKLIPSLKNCTDQLHRSCWKLDSFNFRFLINNYVNEVINEDAIKAGMWLARIAMQLYYDNTGSFYHMLEFMKFNKEDPGVQQLAAEIHTKVKEFDPLMSSGSLPIEFDVLMKYYNHLTELFWNGFDYSIFVKAKIITEKDKDFIVRKKWISGFRILLIKTLNYLLSGDTNVFYKLLDNLQYIPNGDKVALRMQTEIKLFTEQKAKLITEQSTEQTQLATAKEQLATTGEKTQLQLTATKEKTHQSDLEYELFMKYHSKLNHLQSLVNLTSYFVTAKIITSSDAEAVTNAMITESKNTALRKLLNKISLVFLLGRGDSRLFDKMLKIMQIYGDDSTQTLAADMLKTIIKQRPAVLGEEVHLISKPVPMLSKTFDCHGGKLIIEDHDITITVPQLAISEGDKVNVQACASLTGPYMLPDGYELVSVFVCIEADYRFNKLLKITIPHFAAIENLDHSFSVVLLTADDNDIVLNKDGNLVLLMHESVYDYQYEVNDDYSDYYTNHFCSKCLARRRSLVSRLFNRPASSTPREVTYPKTRVTVFFCVPDDYASADDFLIELCICYSFKHCLRTVHKSYKDRKMLSSKSINVPWSIFIDAQKCQNFYLSCGSCPGWKIKPIGSDKIEVGDLDFHTYSSIEDLREQEDRCMYPPRFKISIVRLSRGNILDTEFKVYFGNMDEVRSFSLTVAELANEATSNQRFVTANANSALASSAVIIGATNVTTTITNSTTSSATDISLASSCHSATASGGSSSATMLPVSSVITPALSTPSATDSALVANHQLTANVTSTLLSNTTATATTTTAITTCTSALSTPVVSVASMTDRPKVKHLNAYVRDSLCAAGSNKWQDLGLILIGESGRNELRIMEINHPHNISVCCDKMLALWLDRDPKASWEKLIAALNDIYLDTIASDLTKIISQNE